MIIVKIKKAYQAFISKEKILETAEKCLLFLEHDPTIDLSILIDSDKTLQNLNHQYLGYDQPTDVLSFESQEIDPETGRINLGDIIISYPSAEKQAIEAGHPVENEVMLLLIHGILHLSGFNHSTKQEKKDMWQQQQAILTKLSIIINRISGDEEFHD